MFSIFISFQLAVTAAFLLTDTNQVAIYLIEETGSPSGENAFSNMIQSGSQPFISNEEIVFYEIEGDTSNKNEI